MNGLMNTVHFREVALSFFVFIKAVGRVCFRPFDHSIVALLPQLLFPLGQGQIHVREKRAVQEGDHLWPFPERTLLVAAGHGIHRRAVPGGIAEGMVRKGTNSGVVGPDVGLRIDGYQIPIRNTLVDAPGHFPALGHGGAQWNGPQHLHKILMQRNGQSVRANDNKALPGLP